MTPFVSTFWTFLWLAHAGWNGPTSTPAIAPAVLTADTVTVTARQDFAADGFDPGRSDFLARFGDQEVRYDVMAVFVLPGEEVAIEVPGGDPGFVAETDGGTLRPDGFNRWSWRAPDDGGAASVRLASRAGGAMTLHALTLVPYGEMKRGMVRGYRVGAYPAPRGRRAAFSPRPRGFVEVTAANQDLAVSPHFRLGQFVCKEGAGFPKYVVLEPRLLARLESLLADVNRRGFEASTLEVMSAYRTPRYNRAIGNTTSFTRHQYGDAADVFVDVAPVDGRMDDLNRDGRLDRRDAVELHRWAERLEGAPEAGGVEGGLSAYGSTSAHGPFVHVDTRGYPARW
jgi:hypothetical protein